VNAEQHVHDRQRSKEDKEQNQKTHQPTHFIDFLEKAFLNRQAFPSSKAMHRPGQTYPT
jgi:hypothetical protein